MQFIIPVVSMAVMAAIVALVLALVHNTQFIVPVVSMAVMAAIVALVLTLVHKLLTVEGEAKVKISNDGNIITLPLGANLMKGLQEAGYALFAQCGGKGTCATCRVKPLEGFSSPTPAQLGPLSPKLRKEGWVLSCQINLNKDLVIELFKPLVLSWPTVTAKPEEAKIKEAAVPQPQLSPLAAKVRNVLPGFDCDACGYPTCEEYAEAVASGKIPFDRCLPGGRLVLEKVKRITKAAKIREVLPGFDCDACGYPTCEEYAEAVASGRVSFDGCLPGGRSVLERVKARL